MRNTQSDYTEEQLRDYLAEDTKKGKLASLYNEYYVSKSRLVKDKKIKIFDFIAEYLLEHKVKELYEKNIETIQRQREDPYRQEGHFKKGEKKEKWLAKLLLGFELDPLGKFIDFETPIKGKNEDGAGEIDLLAYNEDKKKLLLVELKLKNNDDTMLHTVLQVCTYYHQINKEEIIKDFNLPSKTKIGKAVLIFKDSPQCRQYKKSEYIRQLAKELDVEVFVLDYELIAQ